MKVNHNFTPPCLLLLTNPLCMMVCQPPLVGSGEHYFLIKFGEKVSTWVGCSWVLYSTNWENMLPYRKPHHKTHNNTQQPT